MTDCELLELAAKAAGIDLQWETPFVAIGDFAQFPHNAETGDRWDALTDDGDALRLAVKLKFNFAYKPEDTDNHPSIKSGVTVWLRHPVVYDLPHTTQLPRFVHEEHNNDPYAATRRAIVRAAAAIGKVLK